MNFTTASNCQFHPNKYSASPDFHTPKNLHRYLSQKTRPTPPCISGFYLGSLYFAGVSGFGSTRSAVVNLVLLNRRVAQSMILCVTLRLNQTGLQHTKHVTDTASSPRLMTVCDLPDNLDINIQKVGNLFD